MLMLAVAGVATLAFFVQGYTGFGAALVMTPLLALLIDLRVGVVAAALVQVPVGMWLTMGARRGVDRPALVSLVPASAVGLILGTLSLATLDVTWLARLCGALTAVFALDVLRRAVNRRAVRPWPTWAALPAGLAGGLLGGLFGTSGPPIVAYLERQLTRGSALRATLLAYFLAINLMRLIGYGAASLYSDKVLLAAAAMLPGASLGAWAGATFQRRTTEGPFRLTIAVVLLLTGVALAVR
jgi:hypothetical protein